MLADQPGFATTQPTPETTLLIAPLWDQTVVAFHVSRPPEIEPPPFECEGAIPDVSLGGRAGWWGQRARAVAKVEFVHDPPFPRLVIGVPGAGYGTPLTVSARSLDRGVFGATFANNDGHWQAELTVDSGARMADGFPTHWVVQARFARSGCWQINVATDDFLDTIIVPIVFPPELGSDTATDSESSPND